MTLKEFNPYLRSHTEATRKAALRISAKTSSAVEGIRAPFATGVNTKAPATQENFAAYWQQRPRKQQHLAVRVGPVDDAQSQIK